MSSNWFAQAGSTGLGSTTAPGNSTSGGLFGSTSNATQNNNSNTASMFGGGGASSQPPQSPSTSLLFGGQQGQPSPTSLTGNFFSSQQGGGLSDAQLAAIQPLKQRYLESFNPSSGSLSAADKDGSRWGQSPKQSASRSLNKDAASAQSGVNSSGAATGGSGQGQSQAENLRFGTHSLYGNGGFSNIAYGGGSPGAGGDSSFAMDEDAPPQVSYMDDPIFGGSGGSAALNASQHQLQPKGRSMDQTDDTSGQSRNDDNRSIFDQFSKPANLAANQRLMVFGVPYSQLEHLQAYLSRFGSLTDFELGPPGSNYVVVSFADIATAARVFRKSGDLMWGNMVLGVKVYDDTEDSLSTSAAEVVGRTVDSSSSTAVAQSSQVRSSQAQRPALTGLDSMVNVLKPTAASSGSVFVNNAAKRTSTPQKQMQIAPEYMFGEGTPGQQPGQAPGTPGSSRWFGMPVKLSETLVSASLDRTSAIV